MSLSSPAAITALTAYSASPSNRVTLPDAKRWFGGLGVQVFILRCQCHREASPSVLCWVPQPFAAPLPFDLERRSIAKTGREQKNESRKSSNHCSPRSLVKSMLRVSKLTRRLCHVGKDAVNREELTPNLEVHPNEADMRGG